MVTQETRQILQGIGSTNYGKALKELLDEKYAELNNVKSCNSWEDTKGRAYALGILDDIFSFMKDRPEGGGKARYD